MSMLQDSDNDRDQLNRRYSVNDGSDVSRFVKLLSLEEWSEYLQNDQKCQCVNEERPLLNSRNESSVSTSGKTRRALLSMY